MNYLNKFWPNLKKGPNKGFWKNEYKKHMALAASQHEEYYFESTVWMMRQIPKLTQKLEHKGCILYFYII